MIIIYLIIIIMIILLYWIIYKNKYLYILYIEMEDSIEKLLRTKILELSEYLKSKCDNNE
jgi:hypothetical protein